MKSHKTVYVNPVPRPSVQGRDKQVYSFSLNTGQVVQTRSMGKTKEFGIGSEFQFLINFDKNRLDTGLDETIENPFSDSNEESLRAELSLSSHWSKERLENIIAAKQLKKQTYFELLADVQEGFYTSEIGATIFNTRDLKKAPEPYFLQKFKIILYDRPNKFTSETPRGRLAIQLLTRLQNVAKDKLSINSAFHDFYISEENEAEMEKLAKQDKINEGIYHLYKMKEEFTDYQKYKLAVLMKTKDGKVLVKGDVNSLSVNTALNNYVTFPDPQQLHNINNFLEVVKLMDSAKGQEAVHIKYLIQQAVNANIISIRDGFYIWNSKASTPNMYKFTDFKKLYSLMKSEYVIYNPEDTEHTNWYGELLEEVKNKGIKILD